MPANLPCLQQLRIHLAKTKQVLITLLNPAHLSPYILYLIGILQHDRVKRFLWPIFSIGLFALSIVVIRHILNEVSLTQLLIELRKLSWEQIALALLYTAGSFVALTGYDWTALSYLGRKLPLKVVFLGSFCGCAVANTLGWNLITGTSVRYNIYSKYAIDGMDVARITLFGALAYGLGISAVAAVVLIVQASTVAGFFGLPAWVLNLIGVFGLGLLIRYLILPSLKTSTIKVGSFEFKLPNLRITLAQLFFSVFDMIFTGACLYILLPDTSAVPFFSFFVANTVSMLVGMISHVPGGLGVFESIMLFTFKQAFTLETLAAALVAYRVIYYLLPLLLAFAILIIREIYKFMALR